MDGKDRHNFQSCYCYNGITHIYYFDFRKLTVPVIGAYPIRSIMTFVASWDIIGGVLDVIYASQHTILAPLERFYITMLP